MHSQISVASALLGGVVGVLVGVAFAVSRRWWQDWRDTKAKLRGLRKGFFGSLWALIKLGTLAALALILVGWWAYRDVTDEGPTPLVPSSSADPSEKTRHPNR